MKKIKAHSQAMEDRLISRVTLIFLAIPLFALSLAGLLIAL